MNMEESNNGSLSAEFKHLVCGRNLVLLHGAVAEGEGREWPHVTEMLFAFLTDPERAKMWERGPSQL